jgi:hypothetical protein
MVEVSVWNKDVCHLKPNNKVAYWINLFIYLIQKSLNVNIHTYLSTTRIGIGVGFP